MSWGSAEQLAVGPKPGEPERLGIRLAVDLEQVRLDMAFSVAGPVPAQRMIAIRFGKVLVGDQQRHDTQHQGVDVAPMAEGCSGPLEGCGMINRPLSGPP